MNVSRYSFSECLKKSWLVPILFSAALGSAYAIDAKLLIGSSVRVFCIGEEEGKFSTGSGFLVDKSGKFALTNSHVITDCKRIEVYSPRDSGEPKNTTAKVVWDSRQSTGKQHLDMALLEFESSVERTGVVFASKKTVQIQDPVIAVGYPGISDPNKILSEWIKPTITQGTISKLTVLEGEQDQKARVGIYQITAPVQPGNSGGPLFNEYGEVIGINTRKATVQVNAQGVAVASDGVAWAQEIDEVLPLLQERRIDVQLREERRGMIGAWLHRDPVTAGVLGVLGVLVLSALAVVMRKQSVALPAAAPVPVSLPTPAPAPTPAIPRASPHVVGVSGPYAGSRFPLDTDIVFGRDPKSCSVVFAKDQDGISSRHCSLRFDPTRGDFELRDLGSANGTFVNGRQITAGQPAHLRDGDEFHLFKSQYRFVVRTTT